MLTSDPAVDAAPAWLDRRAYPFTHRRLELAPGHGMHYVDEGAGDIVLFVHGTPTWSFEWREMVHELSDRWRCVAPDHLGFGLSDRPTDGAYTPEWHAANLARFVERLELTDVTLVVHDYGGPIALPLALAEPSRVRRLVVLNTWMWSLADDKAVVRASRLLGGGFGRFLYRRLNFSLRVIVPAAFADRKKLTKPLHRQWLAPFPDADSRGRVLWPLAHALTGSDAHYGELWRARGRLQGMPSLIVWGTKDPAFPPHHLARWREVLPQAEVVELPVGHWPQEEAPDEVIGAMRRFLGAGG